MKTFEFEIIGLPKTPNELLGRHWKVRARHATKWHGMVMVALNRFKPLNRALAARLTLTRHSASEMDYDGLSGSFKAIVDALVKCGVIEDDKMSNIGRPEYLWVRSKRGMGKITVKVEQIQPATNLTKEVK